MLKKLEWKTEGLGFVLYSCWAVKGQDFNDFIASDSTEVFFVSFFEKSYSFLVKL